MKLIKIYEFYNILKDRINIKPLEKKNRYKTLNKLETMFNLSKHFYFNLKKHRHCHFKKE